MKKVYVGIDAHKAENVFDSAVEDRGKAEARADRKVDEYEQTL
jgi:hypothetical protein